MYQQCVFVAAVVLLLLFGVHSEPGQGQQESHPPLQHLPPVPLDSLSPLVYTLTPDNYISKIENHVQSDGEVKRTHEAERESKRGSSKDREDGDGSSESERQQEVSQHELVVLMESFGEVTQEATKRLFQPGRIISRKHPNSLCEDPRNSQYGNGKPWESPDGDNYRWSAAQTPEALPGPEIDDDHVKESGKMPTAPPNVCDLCPVTGDFSNPLYPCTCVGNGGTSKGMISITCPPSTATLDQLKDVFTHTDFYTTHVFRFQLEDSNVTGVLSKDLWGDLDFVQFLMKNNQITHVDNHAFNNSADTLTLLDLKNNKIKNYVISTENDLPNLTTLSLSRNCIEVIFSNYFTYASLKVLDLSYNLIHTIGENSFADLDKLEELCLDHNQLRSIDEESFHFYNHNPESNFLVIDLSFNQIKSINPTAFLGLRLVQIDFQYNQLITIPQNIFEPIIINSMYFTQFFLCGNLIVCDCSLLWAVEDSRITACFDNFYCYNTHIPFFALEPSDLGNCTTV